MSATAFDPSIPDESRSFELYATLTVVTVLLLTTTSLRIGSKLAKKIPITVDDYLIILGTALNLVGNGFDYKATASGFGRHEQYLSIIQRIDCAKFSQLAVCLAAFAICAIKCSICFFLLNIIKGTHHRFAIAIWILLAFTIVSTFISLLLWGLQAKPIAHLWDPRIPGTRSSEQSFVAVVYMTYAFGVFTDVLYALSPVYFLWGVKIKLRRKLTILCLTGSGLLITIVAALNISYTTEFLQPDQTWALVNEFICDIIERNMSAVIVNLPATWHLVHRKSPGGSSNSNTNYGSRTAGFRSDHLNSTDRETWKPTASVVTYDEGDSIPLRAREGAFGDTKSPVRDIHRGQNYA